MNKNKRVSRHRWCQGILLVMMLALISCYHPPAEKPASQAVAPTTVTEVKQPDTHVYFYPKNNQAPEQQDRDRYECYNWAMEQTRFDPNMSLPPPQRVMVVPTPPPGHDTAVLGITGAAIGAMAAGHHNAAAGAAVGLITGAAIGAVSDSARQDQADKIQEAYNKRDQARNAQFERQGYEFRRAMSACLEGRGYTVK
jgi:hypothetical protein